MADLTGIVDSINPANQLKVNADGSINAKSAAGTALAGGVNVVDSAGTNKLTVDSGGRITSIIQAVAGTALAADQSNSELRMSMYGKNSTAGDTPFLLDSSGRPMANIAQWNGSAPSVSNPVITEDQIRAWIANGQGFSATTGKLTAAGSITGGLSVFNPNASGKTLLIFSIRFMIGNNCFNMINFTTSDPALGTSVSAVNMKAANGTSSVATCSSSNTNVTPAGTTFDMVGAGSNTNVQVLANGHALIIPANNGIAFYSNISGANVWYVAMAWIEF
jgi:hypothetical protein